MRSLSLLLVLSPLTLALNVPRQASGFFNPAQGGGSMLTDTGNGLGEPLNVIISGLSSSQVLSVSGVTNYAKAIGFSTECLGIHLGDPQSANLGDGNGAKNQSIELREDFGDPNLGTCLESLNGGNHFRVFIQNGAQHDTGALFLAASQEQNAANNHNIVANGYDIGRDNLVSMAVGTKSFGGVTYQTTSQTVSGLLPVGSAGINHGIAIDGIVNVLTVTVQ
ncbi:hypothetical protein K435DRAFT_780735 [Dendrothele bispora CBS 962.96]|uniref:Uncharacterized protein n=1 Tax=Dendrothele bispora (strain CBS 962.96) TaxID=1314807 RepID=A0A4S8LRC5_DENBC|nr:hypothetical protein K435DRAFT_780735 [Dendrothele bispora CBS 962.96]